MDDLLPRDIADHSFGGHDLAPHGNEQTEWWYVQGRFGTPDLDEHAFVVMVFRRKAKIPADDDGWLLLISLTDLQSGVKSVTSRASKTLADNLATETVDILVEAGISAELADAYVDEFRAYGPPGPIQVTTAEISAAPDRLDLHWDRFSICQHPDGRLSLDLEFPGTNAPCHLTLSPRANWSIDRKFGEISDFGEMKYALCPRLHLQGTLAGKVISGQAWFDHQWGGNNWFEASKKKQQVLGWTWLGLNLEDGRDMLVAVSRDMLTGDPLQSAALVYSANGRRQVLDRVEAREIAHWCSPDTHASYPIAWEIKLPEIDAELTFTPATADAEIPIYGFPTAVWEGAGQVTGAINGRQVRGRGHLELFGYALPSAFERIKSRWIEQIDAHIEQVLPRDISGDWLAQVSGAPARGFDPGAFGPMLAEPSWELLSRGGKHWRSVFAILMLRVLGAEVAPYEALITTLPELIHAGSLMIDDIQDRSDQRRGAPTIHTLFGEGLTINAANTLYFLPLRAISRHPQLDLAQRERLHAIAVDLFIAAHLGQAQDLYSQNWPTEAVRESPQIFAERVLQTYRLKTAAPVRALAEMIGVIARCDTDLAYAAMDFAEAAGVAYQIMDDVNNFAAGPSWGKHTGEDLREGRMTYVILRALNALDGTRRARLVKILTARPCSETELREGCALVTETGVLDQCRTEARDRIETAWKVLSAQIAPSQSKTLLRLMFTQLFQKDREAPPN